MMVMFAFTTQAAYYIVGNAPFGDWNPGAGVEMTQNADGTYGYTATISGSVWFVFADGLDSNWDTFNANYRFGPSGSDVEVGVGEWVSTPRGGDKSYKFTGSGSDYVFTFNPFANKFKIEGYVDPGALEITSYTVAGSPASVFGTEWDPANTSNDMLKQNDGTYILQKFGCELAGGSNLEFKVAGNHAWGDSWPEENYVVPIEENGIYDLTFTINPETKEVGFDMAQSGTIDVLTGELYILGEVNGNGWDPSNGLKMDTEDGNIFTALVTTEGNNIDENDGIGYSYFSFTTKLGENSEDWGGIGAFRIGATEDGFPLTDDMFGIEVPMGNFGQPNSFKVPAGDYSLMVNLEAKTLVINKEIEPESPYTLEKVWEITDLSFMPTNDVRQGFGMNGKFYIQNKADQAVMVVDENGLANTTYPGGTNCGISRDEAGNIVVSNAAFPGAWTEATIKVINPETNDVKEYVVPEECGIAGRCDFIGFAKGNLMEDGVLYLVGGTNEGVSIMTITGGEVNTDECYAAPCDGLSPTTSTVVNPYTDINGEDALLYVTRNAAPAKLLADGDGFVATALALPGKAPSNGAFPILWEGKEYFLYPAKTADEPNYVDGFAIGEAGADEPIVFVPATVAAAANGFQCNWLNAEVDEYGVLTIYQYYPGSHLSVYRLTSANIPEPEVTEAPAITTEETEEGVMITATGNGEVHLYVNGNEVNNPFTIAYGEEDVTYVITATAKEEGKLISETVTLEVVVPAKPVTPDTPFKLEKVWEITDLSFMPTNDVRQGFGMNGKFYINNKADQKVVVVDENGMANTEYPGGTNCGISRDEAGNIVVSNAAFPGAWTEATIKVINPETNDVKEYVVPEECGIAGRCDFIGFAKGNLMEDGVLYLVGGTNEGVSIMTITGGEVNTDECYAAPCDGLSPTTSTVVNPYTDINGEDALLYVTRNAAPAKLLADGDGFVATALALPSKAPSNGAFPFLWDGKEYILYPAKSADEPNYVDGFAVAELGAAEPIVIVPATVAAAANGFQCNWLNAEVDETGVTIYQYYPGSHVTVYRLTNEQGGIEELITDTNKVVAGVRYYNIMGQEMKQANGITIVVTTYTDGTSSAVKIVK